MKTTRNIFILFFLFTYFSGVFAQSPESLTDERRERRKNLTVREYNTEGKRSWLDHMTVYNPNGYKIEEVEYASYGMVSRITFEYDKNNLCIKEVVYDGRNKVIRVRKYEYNADGTKRAQYNYLPNGKLYSTKKIEYSYQ